MEKIKLDVFSDSTNRNYFESTDQIEKFNEGKSICYLLSLPILCVWLIVAVIGIPFLMFNTPMSASQAVSVFDQGILGHIANIGMGLYFTGMFLEFSENCEKSLQEGQE